MVNPKTSLIFSMLEFDFSDIKIKHANTECKFFSVQGGRSPLNSDLNQYFKTDLTAPT